MILDWILWINLAVLVIFPLFLVMCWAEEHDLIIRYATLTWII